MKSALSAHYAYEPIGDKVLLALPREDVNQMVNVGGIIMPQGAALKNSPLRDTVALAVGPECKQVRAGDTVRWNVGNGQPFPDGNDDLYFIPEAHLVCITKRLSP